MGVGEGSWALGVIPTLNPSAKAHSHLSAAQQITSGGSESTVMVGSR